MRVFLLAPKWGHVYGGFRHLAGVANPQPPLGLCALKSVLARAGHQALVVDAEASGLDPEPALDLAREYGADLVGIAITTPVVGAALDYVAALSRLGVPIVAGGPHPSVLGERFLDDFEQVDMAVIGEGDSTLPLLLDNLDAPDKVPGAAFRRDRKAVSTPPPTPVPDLDSLPFPDRSDLDFARYRFSVPGGGVRPTGSLFTARGCPFKCVFCSQESVFGDKVRFRDPLSVFEEIRHMYARGARHLVFVDDCFTLSAERVAALCRLLARAGMDLTMECETRVSLADRDLLSAMSRAGFRRIGFGVESGDPEVLAGLNKGITLDEARRAFRAAKGAGLETRGTFMIGGPNETRQSLGTTLEFMRSLGDMDQVYINIAAPYPGTELRRMALEGVGGLRLTASSYDELRRYDFAAVEVGELSGADLVGLQKRMLLLAHLTPRRIVHNLRRAGPAAALRNLWAFIRGLFS